MSGMNVLVDPTEKKVRILVVQRKLKIEEHSKLLIVRYHQYEKIPLEDRDTLFFLFHVYVQQDMGEVERFETQHLTGQNLLPDFGAIWRDMPDPTLYDGYDFDSLATYVIESVSRRVMYFATESRRNNTLVGKYDALNYKNKSVQQMMETVLSKDELSIVAFETMTLLNMPMIVTSAQDEVAVEQPFGISRFLFTSVGKLNGLQYVKHDGEVFVPFEFPRPFSDRHRRVPTEAAPGTPYGDMIYEQKFYAEHKIRSQAAKLTAMAVISEDAKDDEELAEFMDNPKDKYLECKLQKVYDELLRKACWE